MGHGVNNMDFNDSSSNEKVLNDSSEKRGFWSKRIIWLYFFLFILIVLILVSFFVVSSKPIQKKIPTCGDGTFYNTCSLNKPYYCLSGKLVLNASVCGCPKNFTIKNQTCYNDYFKEARNVSYKYYLNGKEGNINLTLYGNLSDYLSTLPKPISYYSGEIPRLDDFKLMRINNYFQEQALLPLLVNIENLAPNSRIDQAKIAISLVQNIDYGLPKSVSVLGGRYNVSLAKYPYQVLFSGNGSCEGKSELLVFLLDKMGYSTSLFYYQKQDHEAVGVKCPLEYSLNGTGYCFIETTVPSPVSFSSGTYLGPGGGTKLSNPKVIPIHSGASFPANLSDYKDSIKLSRIIERNKLTGRINPWQKYIIKKIDSKYNLNYGF